MIADTSSAPARSIRALIAELAHVEDEVRQIRRYSPPDDDNPQLIISPRLVDLIQREAEIVAALRDAATHLAV